MKNKLPLAERRPETLRDAIQSHSAHVDLEQLARQKKSGRVLTMSALEKIMTEALANLLLRGTADPLLERSILQEQTRNELRRLLESHQQTVQEKTEAVRARELLEKQILHLRQELDRARAQREGERSRGTGSTLLDAEAIDRVKARLEDWLVQALPAFRFADAVPSASTANPPGTDAASTGDGANPTAPAAAPVDPSAARQELLRSALGVFETAVGEERRRVAEQSDLLLHDSADPLERRIQKLTRALAETEQALQQALAGAEVDSGVQSVYRNVQGLAADAAGHRKKHELIKVVFVNNLRLRNLEVRPEDIAGIPPELLAVPAEPVEPQPSGTDKLQFVKPVVPVTDETAF